VTSATNDLRQTADSDDEPQIEDRRGLLDMPRERAVEGRYVMRFAGKQSLPRGRNLHGETFTRRECRSHRSKMPRGHLCEFSASKPHARRLAAHVG
jgi:hypothetical protein